MSDRLRFRDGANCQVVRRRARRPKIADVFEPKGHFHVEQWRNGLLIATRDASNLITDQGKTRLLQTMFNAATVSVRNEVWYLGLVANDPAPTGDSSDLYDDINQPGNDWDEFEFYDNIAVRGTWAPDAAASKVITNTTPVTFEISSDGDGLYVFGLFACAGPNASGRGNHTAGTYPDENILWCVTNFESDPVQVSEDDQLKVTYTITIS